MTDIYCRPSLGSGGTGTEGDPYGAVADAFAAASNADRILIDTTTGAYAPTALVNDTKGVIWEPWVGDVVEVDGTSFVGNYIFEIRHDDCEFSNFEFHSIPDGDHAFIIATANPAKFEDIVVRDSHANSRATWFGAGFTGAMTARRCKFYRIGIGWFMGTTTGTLNLEDCRTWDLASDNQTTASSSSTINCINCFFGGHDGFELWNVRGSANITFDEDCILLGGAKTSPAPTVELHNSANATVDGRATNAVLSLSFLGFENAGVGDYTFETGFDNRPAKIFSTPRRPEACIAFVRDDLEDYVSGGGKSGQLFGWLDLLEEFGWRGTAFLQTKVNQVDVGNGTSITDAGWSDIQAMIDRGHEVGTHGRADSALHVGPDWLDVQFTGAGTCTLDISGNTLTTTASLGDELNIDLDGINMTSLTSQINAVTDYTATLVDDEGFTANSGAAASLADVTALDITTQKTLQVDWDRRYTNDLLLNRSDIIAKTSLVEADIRTHAYQSSTLHEEIRSRMASSGLWDGARLGSVGVAELGSLPVYKFPHEAGYDPFRAWGYLLHQYVDGTGEGAWKDAVNWLCHWAQFHGARVPIYAHGYENIDLEQWEWIFEEVRRVGMRVCTFKTMLQDATVTSNAEADAWVPTPASAGPTIIARSTDTSRHLIAPDYRYSRRRRL